MKLYAKDFEDKLSSFIDLDGRIASYELRNIFPEVVKAFDHPKPTQLISRLLSFVAKSEAIVLDSFAGSGTTAHSVLQLNEQDKGKRKFILVECEDYADDTTAERIRRVIAGVPNSKNPEQKNGLVGTFTYCTLGDPVELDAILTGKSLPAWDALGSVLFHMATNQTLDVAKADEQTYYLGETTSQHVWLIYMDDLDWLKSPDAAFTLSFARDVTKAKSDKTHLVFAPSRFVSKKILAEEGLNVEFSPLPFALYRIERD